MVERFQFKNFGRAFGSADKGADTLEQGAGLMVIQDNAEIVVELPHRMKARVFAQNQPVAAAQFGRIHALVVQRMLEQAIDMNAGLVGERTLADQTLVPGERSVGGSGNPPR